MTVRVSLGAVVAALAAAAGVPACGGSTDVGGGGQAGPTNPFPCASPRTVPDPSGQPSGIELCADGTRRRVGVASCGGSAGTGTCTTDGECGAGTLCSCAVTVEPPAAGGGLCFQAYCRTGADCAEGFDCRLFVEAPSTCPIVQHYDCQTPDDECVSAADCPPERSMCARGDDGVHRCAPPPGCPVPGRPFLVGGVPSTADCVVRMDWLGTPEASVAALPEALREQAADHFTRAGLMEHASVAAFARFALQLVQLGAPAELLADTQAAMGDEIDHARVCFALASAHGGTPVGPGPLDVGGALGGADLGAITRLTFREGCVGETIAAVEAVEAAMHTDDPGVRAALEKIAADEMRHAALAWRFVRWALALDASLALALAEELRAERFRRAPAAEDRASWSADELSLARHGVLPERHSAKLAHQAVRDVVTPLTRALLQRTPSDAVGAATGHA